MNYKSYPNSKTQPSRTARKAERSKAFQHNRKLAKLTRKKAKEDVNG